MRKLTDEMTDYSFWQPFIITYAITLLVIVFTYIVHYNIAVSSIDTYFYKVDCKNYFLLSFAKVAESLIPTTLTFGITLIVAEYSNVKYNSMGYTLFIVTSFVLFLLGLLTPIVKSMSWLWILLFFVYATIVVFLILLKALVHKKQMVRTAKSEKSDGKFN